MFCIHGRWVFHLVGPRNPSLTSLSYVIVMMSHAVACICRHHGIRLPLPRPMRLLPLELCLLHRGFNVPAHSLLPSSMRTQVLADIQGWRAQLTFSTPISALQHLVLPGLGYFVGVASAYFCIVSTGSDLGFSSNHATCPDLLLQPRIESTPPAPTICLPACAYNLTVLYCVLDVSSCQGDHVEDSNLGVHCKKDQIPVQGLKGENQVPSQTPLLGIAICQVSHGTHRIHHRSHCVMLQLL